MKILIVYTHPNPKSFNHAILEKSRECLSARGHEIRVRDLYAVPFRPVLNAADFQSIFAGKTPDDVQKEQALVRWAEALVFIYPIWWFERPAILKGWIDRVFLHGFAFEISKEGVRGLLKHEKAAVITTTGGDEESYKKSRSLETIHGSMTDGTLKFCGIPDVAELNFYAVPSVTQERREAMLAELDSFFTKLF